MKRLTQTTRSRLLLSAMLATGAACALAEIPPALAYTTPPTAAAAALPSEMQYAGIHYVTGGVGANEAKAFRAAEHQYPLAIELAEQQNGSKHDALTSNAQIRITDHGGKEIFNAQSKGPFMLVRLEPGKYSMTATLNNRTLHKRDFMIEAGKSTRETVVFPAGTG